MCTISGQDPPNLRCSIILGYFGSRSSKSGSELQICLCLSIKQSIFIFNTV